MEHPDQRPTKLLFVCSRNRRRSPTAERIFRGVPGLQVRSAGTRAGARVAVTAGHLGWADIIFVMEKSHLDLLRRKFPEALQDKRIVTLRIPDEYRFMQRELIDELRAKVSGHVEIPEFNSPPTDALFGAGGFRAAELVATDIPRLQRFFELNPEYFLAVNGQPPTANEAHEEFHWVLPEGWSFSKIWIIGFRDEANDLIGVAGVVSDLLAAGVWHIGLFMVATRLHGSGAAQSLFAQLEAWCLANGARWLRLGVVAGNGRAERFWERNEFVEVRQRAGVTMGRQVNTLRVMAKPLAGGQWSDYFAEMARDRPESCG
jgi:predicted protein tyrosine phosphatase/GNAT superfamily N-acetyltransferase